MGKRKVVNAEVTLKDVKGNPHRLIKKFIKKVKKARLVDECRDRMYYEKPSAKRRRLKKRKLENARKAQRERNKKLNIN